MIACATIIAAGVNSQPSDAERPAAREQQVDEEADDHRRQAHAGVERERDEALAAEAHQAEQRAERHADERGEQQRRARHAERQRDDLQQLGTSELGQEVGHGAPPAFFHASESG